MIFFTRRNDPVLIGKIYSLFLGTFVAKDKQKSKNNPKPELCRVPANTRLRLKLMPHLLKSREAALQV
jgi:proteasome component ECM29